MNLDTLEERIEKPSYLLLVVSILMLLIIGWVNLISVQSEEPAIFGWFSVSQLIFLLVYSALLIWWALLLRQPNNNDWLINTLTRLQDTPLLGIVTLGVLTAVLASFFVPSGLMETWLYYPALITSYIISFLIFVAMILIYRNDQDARPKIWRWIGFLAIGVIGIEILLQAGSLLGLTPMTTSLREPIGPVDRIYFNNEDGGTVNGIANTDGWYFPEFRFEEESHRIALLGDKHVRGLGVSAEENLGVILDQKLIEEGGLDGENPEAFSLGFPEYDAALFLNGPLVGAHLNNYEFDELIVYFDLGDDFQTITAPSNEDLFFIREGDGAVLAPGQMSYNHDISHHTLWGDDGAKPNRIINSHVMLARTLSYLTNSQSSSPQVDSPQTDLIHPNSFLFYEDLDDEAQFLVKAQLTYLLDTELNPQGVPLHFVTIPSFSSEFFAQSNSDWETQFGEADYLLPEQGLKATTESLNVNFLAMGEYLKASGYSTSDIQALYMANGTGQFTPAGHEAFALATFECFYSQSLSASQGCYIRN